MKKEFLEISWKRYLLPPIHPEGIRVVLIMTCVVTLLGLLSSYIWIVGMPVLGFALYFFRNPERIPPEGDNLVLAPADGIVCAIREMVPPETLNLGNSPLIRVSTFMSVFNVHVNRNPVSGMVCALKYHPGKFVNVAHKDSEDNERQEICVQKRNGTKIGYVQIAGLVARRIFCPLQVGQQVKRGQVFGLIRFGSRLDVYLPKGVKPLVELGQTMVAGETIIADLTKGKSHER